MDYVLTGQTVALGDFCIACKTAAKRCTFGEQFWASRAVDCSVYAATAQKRVVRRVYDGIALELGDVLLNDV